MDFNEYMKDKIIFNSNNYLTTEQGLDLFIQKENEYDLIGYSYLKKLLILNIPILESNNDGKYYYEYIFNRDCDIISGFNFIATDLDVTFTFICGYDEYNILNIKEFLLTSSIFNELKLRITFNKIPEINKEILIYYCKYICNNDIRNYLNNNKIITSSLIYNNGVCIKK